MNSEIVKEDPAGNKYKVTAEGKIFLKLKSGRGAIRHVGQVFNEVLIVEKNDRHTLKVNKSWGFNEQIIKDLDPTEVWVLYKGREYGRGYYRIGRALFDEFKEFLHFKTSGFERQVFVPIKHFERQADKPKGDDMAKKKKAEREARVLKIGDPLTFATNEGGTIVAQMGKYIRVKFHGQDIRRLGFNEEYRKKHICRAGDGSVIWEGTTDELRAVLKDKSDGVVFK